MHKFELKIESSIMGLLEWISLPELSFIQKILINILNYNNKTKDYI